MARQNTNQRQIERRRSWTFHQSPHLAYPWCKAFGSVLIYIFGIILLVGWWVTVQPKRSSQPFPPSVITERLPHKTERCCVEVTKNILLGDLTARLNRNLAVSNVLDHFFGHGQRVSTGRNVLKLPAESPQFEIDTQASLRQYSAPEKEFYCCFCRGDSCAGSFVGSVLDSALSQYISTLVSG